MDAYLYLALKLLITAAAYMAFPFSYMMFNMWKTGKKLVKETIRRICLWNSIGIGAFFFVMSSLSGSQWTPLPAVLYYYINCFVLDSIKD
jgi:hypothetical protein